MSNKSTSNFSNVVAFIGILIIGFIMYMPIDQNEVSSDMQTMPANVQSIYKDCPKINRDIKNSGGTVKYYRSRVVRKRSQQGRAYGRRKQ